MNFAFAAAHVRQRSRAYLGRPCCLLRPAASEARPHCIGLPPCSNHRSTAVPASSGCSLARLPAKPGPAACTGSLPGPAARTGPAVCTGPAACTAPAVLPGLQPARPAACPALLPAPARCLAPLPGPAACPARCTARPAACTGPAALPGPAACSAPLPGPQPALARPGSAVRPRCSRSPVPPAKRKNEQ